MSVSVDAPRSGAGNFLSASGTTACDHPRRCPSECDPTDLHAWLRYSPPEGKPCFCSTQLSFIERCERREQRTTSTMAMFENRCAARASALHEQQIETRAGRVRAYGDTQKRHLAIRMRLFERNGVFQVVPLETPAPHGARVLKSARQARIELTATAIGRLSIADDERPPLPASRPSSIAPHPVDLDDTGSLE